VVVGGSLIALFSPASGTRADAARAPPFWGVNCVVCAFCHHAGGAPLLFVQVIYGHFFYSSSGADGGLLDRGYSGLNPGYYGTYIHARRREGAPRLAGRPWRLAAVLFLKSPCLCEQHSLMVSPAGGAVILRTERHVVESRHPALAPRYLICAPRLRWPRYCWRCCQRGAPRQTPARPRRAPSAALRIFAGRRACNGRGALVSAGLAGPGAVLFSGAGSDPDRRVVAGRVVRDRAPW